jgi:3-oxoacyl-[acyl-carrier protein] reductase
VDGTTPDASASVTGAPFSLSGRSVIVAGAGGGGIGSAVALMVAAAGGTVVALDVDDVALADLDRRLASISTGHRSLVVDLRVADQVESAVAEASGSGPPLHGLVHVAGGLGVEQWSAILDMDLDHFDDVKERNLRAAVITTRAAARFLVARGAGSIITVASVAALSSLPFGSPYAAAKAALLSYTRTAALEWGAAGVRVNAVVPGTIATPKTGSDGEPAPTPPEEQAVLPLGRRGSADDVAGAVLYLLSDLSNWVTGQGLVVDGGSSARPSFLDDQDLPVFVHSDALRGRLARARATAGPATGPGTGQWNGGR